jgi:LacI family transcriptional regulator
MLTDDLLVPPRPSTMRDIAAEVGVSTATVSRVLGNKASVAPSTRQAVLQAIERRPFPGRRQRRQVPQSAGFVAVHCPYVITHYFGVLLSAVAGSLRHHGKRLLLSAEDEDGEEPNFSGLLASGLTDGAILVLPPEHSTVLAELRAHSYPFVVLAPRAPLPANVAAVSAAHMAGARTATEYLIRLGHQRIAAIAGPSDWLSADGRLVGHKAALAATGRLAPEELVVVGGEPTVATGLAAARALLGLAQRPTAIVAFNDNMALGVLQAAAERGLRVPEDLSVVGFDGLELGQSVVPRLTTVRQPLEEMARMSVELLVRIMEHREIDSLHVVLATELVVGASSGPPPR